MPRRSRPKPDRRHASQGEWGPVSARWCLTLLLAYIGSFALMFAMRWIATQGESGIDRLVRRSGLESHFSAWVRFGALALSCTICMLLILKVLALLAVGVGPLQIAVVEWLERRFGAAAPTSAGPCPGCGYRLEGLASLDCPECGLVTPRPGEEHTGVPCVECGSVLTVSELGSCCGRCGAVGEVSRIFYEQRRGRE